MKSLLLCLWTQSVNPFITECIYMQVMRLKWDFDDIAIKLYLM